MANKLDYVQVVKELKVLQKINPQSDNFLNNLSKKFYVLM